MEVMLGVVLSLKQKREEDFPLLIHVLLLAVQGKCRLIQKMAKERCYAGLNVVFLNGGNSFKSYTENIKKYLVLEYCVPPLLPRPSIYLWYSCSIM